MDRHAHGAGQPAAARPASSRPKLASMPSSGTLRRRYRCDTPPACSANVALGHEGSGQRNRRTDSAISTGRPPAAPSATTRAYRREPARTPTRTTGTAPAPPGRTPGSPPCPGVLHLTDPQPAKVREQHEQQLLPCRKPPGHGRRR